MNPRPWGLLAGLAGLAVLAGWAITGPGEDLGPRPAVERPRLALLTSLPLLFAERFGLEQGGSPALRRLEQRYRVEPVAIAAPAGFKDSPLLLMAHPRAQPAEVLVELDQWVRDGGRVLLLADPRLDWPSERPLGDLLRPPPAFADTGLLARWEMTLEGPDPIGPTETGTDVIRVTTSSPGRLSSRSCALAGDGLVARCRVGKGEVTVIADADFLNVEADGGTANLDLLVDELARLESR